MKWWATIHSWHHHPSYDVTLIRYISVTVVTTGARGCCNSQIHPGVVLQQHRNAMSELIVHRGVARSNKVGWSIRGGRVPVPSPEKKTIFLVKRRVLILAHFERAGVETASGVFILFTNRFHYQNWLTCTAIWNFPVKCTTGLCHTRNLPTSNNKQYCNLLYGLFFGMDRQFKQYASCFKYLLFTFP